MRLDVARILNDRTVPKGMDRDSACNNVGARSEVVGYYGLSAARVLLHGFSGSGQFVHRFGDEIIEPVKKFFAQVLVEARHRADWATGLQNQP